MDVLKSILMSEVNINATRGVLSSVKGTFALITYHILFHSSHLGVILPQGDIQYILISFIHLTF